METRDFLGREGFELGQGYAKGVGDEARDGDGVVCEIEYGYSDVYCLEELRGGCKEGGEIVRGRWCANVAFCFVFTCS